MNTFSFRTAALTFFFLDGIGVWAKFCIIHFFSYFFLSLAIGAFITSIVFYFKLDKRPLPYARTGNLLTSETVLGLRDQVPIDKYYTTCLYSC